MQPLILAFMLLGGPPPDMSIMQFREVDGNTQHLYVATCVRSATGTTCSVNVVSVSTDKSPMKCMVSVKNLLQDEPAQSPRPDTFVVTTSSGMCGYSNTYVMSPTGMVHTKTSPPSVTADLAKLCTAFPPATREASPAKGDAGGVFFGVPVGACSAITVDAF